MIIQYGYHSLILLFFSGYQNNNFIITQRFHLIFRSQLNGQAVHSSAVGVSVAQGGAVYVTATQPGAAAAAAAAAAYLSAGQHQAFASARYRSQAKH